MQETFIRLINSKDKQQETRQMRQMVDRDQQDLTPTWCDCCNKKVCIPRQGEHLEEWIKNKKIIADLGIDLQDTEKQRTPCEVDLLIAWCVKQEKVVNSHGLLDPDRDILHNTALSIELNDVPKFKARPDKSTPQSKLDIEKMVEEKLKQGIIEKSSAPWSSNCVVIRKDGKARIAVDYRKLNQITVRDSYLLPKDLRDS